MDLYTLSRERLDAWREYEMKPWGAIWRHLNFRVSGITLTVTLAPDRLRKRKKRCQECGCSVFAIDVDECPSCGTVYAWAK